MVRLGTLVPVNPEKRPNCYLARSDVGDGKIQPLVYVISNGCDSCSS
jgi:hypothetical protein